MANRSRSHSSTKQDVTFSNFFEGTTPISEEDVEETFTIDVGEGCKVRQEFVDSLAEGARFKMLWMRVDHRTYRWLASDGDVGTIDSTGLLKFTVKHWEKA